MFFLVAALALSARLMDITSGPGWTGGEAVAQEETGSQATQAGPAGDEGESEAPASDGEGRGETRTADAVTGNLNMGLPSDEEMRLITQLRQRREELDKRAQQLDLQEQLLASTEKRINDKIAQLEALEGRIQKHLHVFEDREAKQLESVVEVYETMKAKEAAPRFQELDLQTQLDLVTRMKARKVAALMAEMNPRKATALTTELATMADPPTLEDVNSGGAPDGGDGQ
ncbi:MotE family protein [Yunchengibacter salinarum]|uniref:MotE family protein n=1 Tax=Yunchengibacter salinarum TaxID=3133399 RepID=UPI0035B69482